MNEIEEWKSMDKYDKRKIIIFTIQIIIFSILMISLGYQISNHRAVERANEFIIENCIDEPKYHDINNLKLDNFSFNINKGDINE